MCRMKEEEEENGVQHADTWDLRGNRTQAHVSLLFISHRIMKNNKRTFLRTFHKNSSWSSFKKTCAKLNQDCSFLTFPINNAQTSREAIFSAVFRLTPTKESTVWSTRLHQAIPDKQTFLIWSPTLWRRRKINISGSRRALKGSKRFMKEKQFHL